MIADLEQDLDGRVAEYARGRPEALAEALAGVVEPCTFQALLGAITGDEALARDVAVRSVWHHNGFAKIVLLATSQFRLRLHVWRKSATATARENVHNHRWDFASVILAGGYRHQEFQVAEDGEGYFKYHYRPAEDRLSYILEPKGRQRLTPVFDAHLTQGSHYTMSSVVLHKVVPDHTRATVSLVLEGPRKLTDVEVFAEDEIDVGASAAFAQLSPEALMSHLSAVAQLA